MPRKRKPKFDANGNPVPHPPRRNGPRVPGLAGDVIQSLFGHGKCRRCHLEPAAVTFLTDRKFFCEGCKVDVIRGWAEFWTPEHRVKTFARYQSLYGIGPEEYGLLYESQAGCCLICRRYDRPLVIDHCHATGIVRGLLCGNCNSAIGLLGDDPDVAGCAVKYLSVAQKKRSRLSTDPGGYFHRSMRVLANPNKARHTLVRSSQSSV